MAWGTMSSHSNEKHKGPFHLNCWPCATRKSPNKSFWIVFSMEWCVCRWSISCIYADMFGVMTFCRLGIWASSTLCTAIYESQSYNIINWVHYLISKWRISNLLIYEAVSSMLENMKDLFDSVTPSTVLLYVRAIGLFLKMWLDILPWTLHSFWP